MAPARGELHIYDGDGTTRVKQKGVGVGESRPDFLPDGTPVVITGEKDGFHITTVLNGVTKTTTYKEGKVLGLLDQRWLIGTKSFWEKVFVRTNKQKKRTENEFPL